MEFNRFGKKIWIASKLESAFDKNGNEIQRYGDPVEYLFNVQPVTSDVELTAFGLVGSQSMKAICNRKKYEGKFKEYDLAYLDGAKPEGEKRNGSKANYRIKGNPLNQNLVTTIYFEKIVKENKNV